MPPSAEDLYDAALDSIRSRYQERILKLLQALKADCEENLDADVNGPYEAHDQEFQWGIYIAPPDAEPDSFEHDVNVDFIIVEQKVREGWDEGDPIGVAFSLNITGYGGLIIGGMSPYNYTDELWVDANDVEAVEFRFKLFEQADMAAATALIARQWA